MGKAYVALIRGINNVGKARRVAYLWCANGVAKSPLWAAVERALERSGTARNIATFTKVIALMEGRTR